MSVVISDKWLHAAQMSEAELRLELAIWLYQQGRLTLALASRLAGLTRLQFQRILSERGIPFHYTAEELAEDLTNLHEVNRLQEVDCK
jgi:predicted HTH domain antitoxin